MRGLLQRRGFACLISQTRALSGVGASSVTRSQQRQWEVWGKLEETDEASRVRFASFLFYIENAVKAKQGKRFPDRQQSTMQEKILAGEKWIPDDLEMDDYEPLDLDTVMNFLENIRNGDSFEPHTVHGIIDRAKLVSAPPSVLGSTCGSQAVAVRRSTHSPMWSGWRDPPPRERCCRSTA